VNILALSGSLDESSSNTALVRAVARRSRSADVTLFESIEALPHFRPDHVDQALPSVVHELRAAVRGADVVVIATPEYAGGVPGSLKNALDWLVGSGELYGKDALVVSAAPSADRGANARASLELTLRMQGARVDESFTVPIIRGDSDALDDAVAEVLDRVERLVESRADPTARNVEVT